MYFYSYFHTHLVAYAYWFAKNRCRFDGYRFLVFDFGRSTFDVSVLEARNGRFEIRCIQGDSNLGGQNLDEELFKYCVGEIGKRWQKECKWSTSIRFSRRIHLLKMCEASKIALTTREDERFNL